MEPTFSLCYTTVRPDSIAKVVALWNSRSELNQHEWIISSDTGHPALEAARLIPGVRVVENVGPKTCVAGWNAAAAASTGKVIIAVADDFKPPQSWDRLLLSLAPKDWINGEYVVHVDDGYVRSLCTLAILTRKRYDRFGYLFYPRYSSMFVDTEFGDVAARDGVILEAMHLLFEHMHCDCGKRAKDAVDIEHASSVRWTEGEQLYNFRKRCGFPLDAGPKAVAAPTTKAKEKSSNFAVYMQVIKDDFCLYEVCARMMEEGANTFFWSEPDKYWSGEPLDPADRIQLDAVAERLKNAGACIHRKVFSVEEATITGDSRIKVETRVRNSSLDWIRAEGYDQILVVDGDELWFKGTLKRIQPYIQQGAPAVSTGLIPVVGLPGYPIEGATDGAVVYIGAKTKFKECRSPFQCMRVPIPCIYHFTGTRKTMDEVLKKHRRSGHYDDKDYDFEGWIAHKLPNIKPGEKDIHMYKPYQIWKQVRDWTPRDLAEIPESLYSWLGIQK